MADAPVPAPPPIQPLPPGEIIRLLEIAINYLKTLTLQQHAQNLELGELSGAVKQLAMQEIGVVTALSKLQKQSEATEKTADQIYTFLTTPPPPPQLAGVKVAVTENAQTALND